MNIFIFDYDIEKNVRYYCDKHVIKMCLETAQIISTVIDFHGFKATYKPTHKNHPVVKWACESNNNLAWLVKLLNILNEEYKYRFNKEKNHKSYDTIINKDMTNVALTIPNMPNKIKTNFVKCMPDKYKQEDVVTSYRNYFNGEKQHIAKWTKRDVPFWFKEK